MTYQKGTKKPAPKDWHRADIKAALEKAGWTLRRLSLARGYQRSSSLQKALERPYPTAERIIAEAIGVAPAEIWPSRYRRPTAARRKNHPTKEAA